MSRFFIRLFLGALIFGILVWKIGASGILKNLTQFKLAALLLINATTLNGFLLGGVGVILLGKKVNPRVEWLGGMKGFLGAVSLSLFIPGRAGDFALPLYWKRFMRYGESLVVILIDKLNTFFWVLSFGACGMYLVFHRYIGFWVTTLVVSFMLFLGLSLSLPRTRIVISRLLPEKILALLQGSMTALRAVGNRGKRTLLLVFVLNGIRIFVYGVGFWVSLWGLDIACPFFYSICLLAIAQLVSFIPISIMGLGTVEAVCVYGLNQIGIEPSLVITALLVGRIIALFWLSLFLLVFSLNRDVARTKSIRSALKIS